MSSSVHVSELLLRWEELKEQGQMVSLEDLCVDAPELLPELRRQVAALSSLNDLMKSNLPLVETSVTEVAGTTIDAVQGMPPGYEILGTLGQGGMGVVYKARHLKLNRIVALKMLHGKASADPRELIRFLVEAEVVAAIKHPNVVQVHEVGEHESRPFLALEYLEGGSLAERLRVSGKLDARSAAGLVAKIAQGVRAAHEQGIVHRDLKPHNVLLDGAGEPRVTDFGIAKRGSGDLTHTNAVMGTPAYMAPEQARGDTRLAGPAADVYALGVILYECLTGTVPFTGNDAWAIIRHVIDVEPVPPRQRVAGVARDLELICLKCLAKEPRDRYPGAAALVDDLGRYLAGESVSVRRARVPERAWRWCRRNPLLATAFGAVATGFVLAGVMAWFAVVNARTAEAKERERLRTSLIEQARAERRAGNRGRSLDLYRQAVALKADPELQPEVIEAITSPGVHSIAEVPFSSVESIHLSPDRTWVAIAAGHVSEVVEHVPRALVEVREVATGNLLAQRFDCRVHDVHPGGRQLLVGDKTTLQLWDFGADVVAGTFPRDTKGHAFSPDGKFLAIADDGGVHVWDLPANQKVAANTTSDFYRVRNGFLSAGSGPAVPKVPAGMSVVKDFGTARKALVHVDRGKDVPAQLVLWDTAAGKELGVLPKEFGYGILPNRFGIPQKLVTSAKELRTLPRQFDCPDNVVTSVDGRFLAFCPPKQPNVVQVWDWPANQLRGQWAGRQPAGIALGTYGGEFSADGSLLAAIGSERRLGVLRVWDVETMTELLSLPGAGPTGRGVAFEPRNGFGWGGRILVIPAPASEPGKDAPTPSHGFQAGNGEWYSFSTPIQVQFWEFTRPTPTYLMDGQIGSIRFDATGKRLAVNDTLWKIGRTPDGMDLRRVLVHPRGFEVWPGPGDRVWAVECAANEHLDALFRRRTDPEFRRLWELGPEPREWDLPAIESPNVTAAIRKYLKLHEKELNGQEYRGSIRFPPWGYALTPDGTRLLLSIGVQTEMRTSLADSPGLMLELWDLEKRVRLRQWTIDWDEWHGSQKYFKPFVSPDGRFAITGSGGHLLDLATGQEVAELGKSDGQNSNYVVKGTGFSPDGQHLLVRGERYSPRRLLTKLYDVQTRQEVRSWEHDEVAWGAFAVAPGGRTIATGGRDRMVHLRDVGTGEELAHWPAHNGEITALAFSPDGKTLVSGSFDGALKLWNLPLIREELASMGLGW